MHGNGSSILRFGAIKVYRWKRGEPTLSLTVPGYPWRAPKLRYGWTPFFVARYGTTKTVFSYRRVKP